jgi:hypothetical protein
MQSFGVTFHSSLSDLHFSSEMKQLRFIDLSNSPRCLDSLRYLKYLPQLTHFTMLDHNTDPRVYMTDDSLRCISTANLRDCIGDPIAIL